MSFDNKTVSIYDKVRSYIFSWIDYIGELATTSVAGSSLLTGFIQLHPIIS